jgi:hypothetical protein
VYEYTPQGFVNAYVHGMACKTHQLFHKGEDISAPGNNWTILDGPNATLVLLDYSFVRVMVEQELELEVHRKQSSARTIPKLYEAIKSFFDKYPNAIPLEERGMMMHWFKRVFGERSSPIEYQLFWVPDSGLGAEELKALRDAFECGESSVQNPNFFSNFV